MMFHTRFQFANRMNLAARLRAVIQLSQGWDLTFTS